MDLLNEYRVEKFCGCISLRKGVFVVGFVQIVVCSAELLILIPIAKEAYNVIPEILLPFGIDFLVKVIFIGLGAMLIQAALKEDRRCLFAWVVITVLIFLLKVFLFVWEAIVGEKDIYNAIRLPIIAVYMLWQVYSIFVVNSFRIHLTDPSQSMEEEPEDESMMNSSIQNVNNSNK